MKRDRTRINPLDKMVRKGEFKVLKPGGLAISVVGPPDAAFAGQVRRPLDETLDAMAYVEQGRAKGKVVDTMPPSIT